MRASASPLLAVLLLAICFGPPSGASAQATLTFTVTQVGTRPHAGDGVAWVSGAECAGSITISTTATPEFDVWRSAVGSNCGASTVRAQQNSPCTHVGHVDNKTDNTFTMLISDLVKTETTTNACTPSAGAGDGTRFEFTLIGTDGNPDITANMPFGTLQLRVDAKNPAAVVVEEDVRSRVGESVSVVWSAATGESETIRYNVYVDSAGTCTDDGVPSSSALTPGSAAPAGLLIDTFDGTSATITPELAGATVGSDVVVAVAAVDVAGNIGTLSPLICVSFVETVGFCDENEDCSKNCAVRMPGAASDEGVPFALLALASLGVVVHARRRRSAK